MSRRACHNATIKAGRARLLPSRDGRLTSLGRSRLGGSLALPAAIFALRHTCRLIVRVLRGELALGGELQDQLAQFRDSVRGFGEGRELLAEGFGGHLGRSLRGWGGLDFN